MQSVRRGAVMAKIEELKEIVSGYMRVEAQTIDESTVLSGLLATSMGRGRLDATLRGRFGFTHPAVHTVKTFGEICQLLAVDATHAEMPAIPGRHSLAATNFSDGSIALGVDIQAVNSLPEVGDYWEEDFYKQHFTRQEIAYALLQSSPRESFAAAWCAKEALRKADNRWIGVDWKLTEITHNELGRPALQSGDEAIPCAISLSHTNGFAVAVVAMTKVPLPEPQNAPIPVTSAVLPVVEERSGSRLSLVLSVAALVVSLAAAAYAFLR